MKETTLEVKMLKIIQIKENFTGRFIEPLRLYILNFSRYFAYNVIKSVLDFRLGFI